MAGSQFRRTTKYSSNYPGRAAKTRRRMRSIRYSAWHTSQVKALAQAQKTPSLSLSWSIPLRFFIHSTRHSSWMYLAEPAQSHTARKGLRLSIVLPQQKRQAGLLSTIDAFACQEQKEQANTLCLSDILGYATCSQWFLVLHGFQKMRSTSRLALPRRILSPSLSLQPVSLRGTMRERGSLSAPSCRSLIKQCPSLWSMRRRGKQLSSLSFLLVSLPSTNANQQFSSFLRRVPEDFTMIFSCELLPFTSEQSNRPQHYSLYQV